MGSKNKPKGNDVISVESPSQNENDIIDFHEDETTVTEDNESDPEFKLPDKKKRKKNKDRNSSKKKHKDTNSSKKKSDKKNKKKNEPENDDKKSNENDAITNNDNIPFINNDNIPIINNETENNAINETENQEIINNDNTTNTKVTNLNLSEYVNKDIYCKLVTHVRRKMTHCSVSIVWDKLEILREIHKSCQNLLQDIFNNSNLKLPNLMFAQITVTAIKKIIRQYFQSKDPYNLSDAYIGDEYMDDMDPSLQVYVALYIFF